MRSRSAFRGILTRSARSLLPSARGLIPTEIILGLLLALSSASAQIRPARPGDLPPIDRLTQAAVLESVCTVMDTMYVIQETAEQTVSRWRDEFRRGTYRDLTDPVEFVQRLQADADAVYRNKHFGLGVFPPADPAPESARAPDPDQVERVRRQMRRQNFGFRKMEILAGNIGYLRLDRFASADDAAEVAIGAMNFLGNTDAVIFDLRANPGGDASMIRLLTTYLFDEQQHLINWYQRDTDQTVQSWTLDYVPGRRLSEIPVYVLVSDRTASAAEEFTFDLQHLQRATVVGDTTAGAGHTVNTVLIAFPQFRVGMRVPYGHAMDPKTGKGWEGAGVVPDIAVAADDALLAAQKDVLERLRETIESPEDSLALAWTLIDLESRLHPMELEIESLREYVGRYGPRQIFLEGDVLMYQREDRPKLPVAPMARDLFRVGDLDYFRLRFERDASGAIVGVTGLYDDGREEPSPRDE